MLLFQRRIQPSRDGLAWPRPAAARSDNHLVNHIAGYAGWWLLSAVASRALPVQIFDHRFPAASRTLLIRKVSRTIGYGGDVFSRQTVPLTAS